MMLANNVDQHGAVLLGLSVFCSISIFWTNYSMVKPLDSKFSIYIFASFLGVPINKNFIVSLKGNEALGQG